MWAFPIHMCTCTFLLFFNKNYSLLLPSSWLLNTWLVWCGSLTFIFIAPLVVIFSSPSWGINWAYKNYNMFSMVPFMWLGKTSSKTPFVGVGGGLILSCWRFINFAWFKFYFLASPCVG
jgi:hypothetical protein